jgi:rod shape-determining protein MreD
MKPFAWILLAFLALALLSPLLGHFDSQFFAPDIALLTALYAGSRTSTPTAILVGFSVGLLKDGLSLSVPVGLYTEVGVLAALLGRFLEPRVDLRSAVPVMATSAALSLAATVVFLILEAVFHRAFDAFGDVVRMALPLALITMLVAPPWFGLLDRVTGRFEHPHRSGLLGRK